MLSDGLYTGLGLLALLGLLFRLAVHFLPREIREKVRILRSPRSKEIPASHISLNESGIVVTSFSSDARPTVEEMRWADIQKATFKRDCFGYDLMCIAIGDAMKAIEVTEQMKGWDKLLDQAPIYLPGWLGRVDWYEKVMLPAFATNQTVIFSRISS